MAATLVNQETLNKAVDALHAYLAKTKDEQPDNVLWEDEQDINLVIEPKIWVTKDRLFFSDRIPLAHSLRKNTDNEICIITRDKDVDRMREVLLTMHPVANVKKIMGLGEFERDYKKYSTRQTMIDLFDLFIVHPRIMHRVEKDLMRHLTHANKSLAVLPNSFDLLFLGNCENPLYKKTTIETEDFKEMQKKKNALAFAELVARFRDSTYLMNTAQYHKFVKLGVSGMTRKQLYENTMSVLNYGVCLLKLGGWSNVFRLSLHVNGTTIQLPFYVGMGEMRDYYRIGGKAADEELEASGKSMSKKDHQIQVRLENGIKNNCFQTTNWKLKKNMLWVGCSNLLHRRNIDLPQCGPKKA